MSSLKYFNHFANIVFVTLFFSLNSSAQTDVPKAIKLCTKNKLENALKYLEKVFEKDSINPEYYYSFSILQAIDSLPFYNLDSAYHHVNTAIHHYSVISDTKKREGLSKNGIDSISMLTHKNRIEDKAFERAQGRNTEAQFNYFLNYFHPNKWTDSIVVLRNEKAFETAINQNTYVGYRKFIETYPNAKEVDQARYRFERLYFDESTSDQKLSSYETFLKNHPKTPYRDLAEKQILELSTLSGTLESYLSFIKSYPKSKFIDMTRDYIFHLDDAQLPSELWTDSLRNISKVNSKPLFPFYKFQKFGFNSNEGKEIIPPLYQQINDEYLCKTITTDFLIVDSLVINRHGSIIWNGVVNNLADLGSGLLLLSNGEGLKVVHKSGSKILNDTFQDVKLLKGRFIAAKKNNQWGLYSLMGTSIFKHEYSNIQNANDFIIVTKDKMKAITNVNQIELIAYRNEPDLAFVYKDFELLPSGDLLVKSSKHHNILSPQLKRILRESVQEIHLGDNHIIIKEHNLYQIYTMEYELMYYSSFNDFMYNQSSFFVKLNGNWQKTDSDIKYDSAIILSDNISLGMEVDSITLFFNNVELKKHIESVFRIIKDNSYRSDKQEYIVFTIENDIEVYNLRGKKIFSGEVEKITALGPDLLVVQQKGKKRVIDDEGNTITSVKMDAIGNYSDGSFSILSNSKFGVRNATNDISIPPIYQRALKGYNSDLFIAYKDDFYGLINKNNQTITDFEFEEIRFWNDTSALVKLNYVWKIYSWKTDEFLIDNIKDYTIFKNTEKEVIIKILVDNDYGIISNEQGTIVPITYNDIIDIGTDQEPLYLAERNIEEADFYVIIYYNSSGKIIYKQAYEAEDYQNIICDL